MNTPCRHSLCSVLFLILFSSAVPSFAQSQPRLSGQADPIRKHLFAPELVMAHQSELGLDSGQRQQLIAEIQSLQTDLVPLQFQMTETVEALAGVLAEPRIDEDAAVGLAADIMSLEGQIKKRHLTLLVRIKNLLNIEQQRRLHTLRSMQRDASGAG